MNHTAVRLRAVHPTASPRVGGEGLGPLSAAAGAEFAVFDQEHTGWGLETIKVPVVRVPALELRLVPVHLPPP